MNSRERFLAAIKGLELDRPPVWLMRQAGRYLPEYRKLKESYSFTKMVRTPALATEVTLQPLQRFSLDAAIIFSDILVIPEAMGQPYGFREQGGIEMEYKISTLSDIEKLQVKGVPEHLSYVAEALRQTRTALGEHKALLGFAGSPWTVANYMVSGGSGASLGKELKAMYYGEPDLFQKLLSQVTEATGNYLKLQIESGVDAVQIFDSWGSLCDASHYEEMSLKWIKEIIGMLPTGFPVILYAKGMGHLWKKLIRTGAKVISMDWTIDLASMRETLPRAVALQGNLDPILLTQDVELTRTETLKLLERMSGKSGYIFNLGHGITPQAGVDNVKVLVDTVCEHGQ